MVLVSRIQLVGHSAAARELEKSVSSAVSTAAKHAIAAEVTAGAEMLASSVTAGTDEALGLPSPAAAADQPQESLAATVRHALAEIGEDVGKVVKQEARTLEQEAGKAVAQEIKSLEQDATTAIEQSIGLPPVAGSGTAGAATATSAITQLATSAVRKAEAATVAAAGAAQGAASAAGKAAQATASQASSTAKGLRGKVSPKARKPETQESPAAKAAEADAAVAEVDTVMQAASAPIMPASPWAIVLAFALVGAAVIAAWLMPHAKPIEIGSTMATYAALLVFATAVERLLEPFSHWLPGRRARERYEAAVVKVMNGHPRGSLHEVANAHSEVLRASADRTVLSWALATLIATVAATASGFYLLRMVSQANWHATVPTWVDACITGLVVGSGTKPLHDLISRAQTSKDPSPAPPA